MDRVQSLDKKLGSVLVTKGQNVWHWEKRVVCVKNWWVFSARTYNYSMSRHKKEMVKVPGDSPEKVALWFRLGSFKLLYSQYLAENERECSFAALCKVCQST